MKTILISLFISLYSCAAISQTFMTEEELMNTLPGASVSGISNSDGKTEWTQTYGEPKKGKTKGKGKGKFGGDPYKFSWKIKKGKWCENWGDGTHCWEMELVDGNKIRLYKKGKPLENLWTIM